MRIEAWRVQGAERGAKIMLHRNGTPPAATAADKQTASVPPRTEFPPERPIDSSRALLYHVARRQLVGLPVLRWLYMLLMVIPLFATLLLPMPWPFLAALAPLLLIVLWVWEWTERQRSYVRFMPMPAPLVMPHPLSPNAKLPVYVSGLLAVGNKVRLFAGLPGFYRTFATREHALLCQVRHLGRLAAWPEEETGLWYAFFAAGHVQSLRTGAIAFDRASLPGFALDYIPPQPLGGKKKQRQRLTLYVAFAQPEDFQAALADLAVESIAVQTS